jgi:rSAM/selenodomain-associated transferase 1
VDLPRVIVFLRAPELGRVKSRLAATVGPIQALAIYRELLDITLTTLRTHPKVELRVTPDTAATGWEPLLQPEWRRTPQGAGDLGERLQRAVQEAFAREPTPVVLFGCDCPELTEDDLIEAGRLLATRDVVFGPATDGGYWLIGLKRPVPALFRGISWGTSRVLDQSLDIAQRLGLKWDLLRGLADIDTEADWRAWQARSHRGARAAHAPQPNATDLAKGATNSPPAGPTTMTNQNR